MIRLLLADDHDLFRDGLKRVLEEQHSMVIVGEASDSRALLDEVRRAKPDVVLLDLSMPGRGGLENTQEIKRFDPRIKVLILTAHPEDQYAVRCLKSGADGYITKGSSSEALANAIYRVASQRKYISPALAEQLAFSLSDDDFEAPHSKLSDREYQVLSMIGGGQSTSQIANELSLSVKTISTYRSRILEKLRLDNTAQLIRYALENELANS
ncbi:MAG: response regulator transcription factor [Acidobacteriota bacterium]